VRGTVHRNSSPPAEIPSIDAAVVHDEPASVSEHVTGIGVRFPYQEKVRVEEVEDDTDVRDERRAISNEQRRRGLSGPFGWEFLHYWPVELEIETPYGHLFVDDGVESGRQFASPERS
jgi:hypothetical protein